MNGPTRNRVIVAAALVVQLLLCARVWYTFALKDDDTPRKTEDTSQSSEEKKELEHSSSSGESAEGISKEEAGRIATDRYGGEIKSIEDDDYHDSPAWEVEIRDSREGRIEVKVDKSTGEILDVEND